MNVIHQINEAGFTIELLPNNNIGERPNALNQQQRDYLTANKAEIVRQLQIEQVRQWLFKIGEPVEDHDIVLNKCKADSEVMSYFLKHTRGIFK